MPRELTATANRLYDLARPGTTTDGTVSEEVQRKSIEQVVERTDLKEAPAAKKVFDFGLTRKIYKCYAAESPRSLLRRALRAD